jgi:hypothetical protein
VCISVPLRNGKKKKFSVGGFTFISLFCPFNELLKLSIIEFRNLEYVFSCSCGSQGLGVLLYVCLYACVLSALVLHM